MRFWVHVLLLSSLVGVCNAQEVSSDELNMVRSKCETLLMAWDAKGTSESLADEVLSSALTEQKGWDTGGRPSLFRNVTTRLDEYGFLVIQEDTDSRTKELSPLERKIFGVTSKGKFRLQDLKFALEKKVREVITLHVYAGRKHIGAVDLNMGSAVFGYEDRLAEEIARFHRSNLKPEGDTLEKSWLRISELHLRLASIKNIDERFSVGFVFHLVADTLSMKCTTPEEADYFVCKQPIDILLLKECDPDTDFKGTGTMARKLVMVNRSAKEPKEMCGFVLGRISRPGMVHAGLENTSPSRRDWYAPYRLKQK